MRAELRANAGLVIAGIASFVLMGAGQSLYGAALPAFARAFATGVAEAGLLIPFHSVGCAAGVAAMFLRGDRIGPRTALAVMALGTAGIAAGAGLAVTLLAAAAFGAGYGMSTVIYNRRFLAAFGARGPSMLALVNAVFGIGAIGAPLAFVALGSDPRLAYGIIAGLMLLVMGLAGNTGPAVAEAAGPAGGPFRWRPAILGFGALGIGAEACLVGLGPVALIALGVSERGAAEYLSAFFTAFLVARLALVPVAARVPPFALLVGALAGTGAFAALVAGGSVWAFVPLGGCVALVFPGFYVSAVRQMGDHPRVGPAVIAAGLVGYALAPLVMAQLMQAAGQALFFPALAAATLAAAAMGGMMLRGMARATAGAI